MDSWPAEIIPTGGDGRPTRSFSSDSAPPCVPTTRALTELSLEDLRRAYSADGGPGSSSKRELLLAVHHHMVWLDEMQRRVESAIKIAEEIENAKNAKHSLGWGPLPTLGEEEDSESDNSLDELSHRAATALRHQKSSLAQPIYPMETSKLQYWASSYRGCQSRIIRTGLVPGSHRRLSGRLGHR